MRYCAQPHCTVLVNKGRCPTHAKQVDIARGTAQQRGYDYAWSQYSARFRAEHPVCGERADGSMDPVNSRCVQRGLTTPAECVDHTVPLRSARSPEERERLKWDARNHMSACLECNSWKANTLERQPHAPERGGWVKSSETEGIQTAPEVASREVGIKTA
jgi:hypothetical protein